jgi:hypothetical protein
MMKLYKIFQQLPPTAIRVKLKSHTLEHRIFQEVTPSYFPSDTSCVILFSPHSTIIYKTCDPQLRTWEGAISNMYPSENIDENQIPKEIPKDEKNDIRR